MANILNRTTLRRYILAKCKARGLQISRVSPLLMDQYEAKLLSWIIDDVARHPTRGKTFCESVNLATNGGH
jgi:hypothetical protein